MTAVAQQKPADVASEYATLQFVIQQMLYRMQTSMPVRVMKVTTNGGVAPVGRVDVLPLVHQIAGDGTAVPHGTVFNVPYSRVQGGANAIIMDPEVGDIGICLFASRDISSVKANPAAAAANGGANPGSARAFDFADAVYVGAILNAVPTQFVQFSTAGVRVLSPTKITLEAPAIELKGPVTATQTIDAPNGEITSQGTHLHTHTHSGVVPGGGTSGPPSP
jgi:hypothetical protein